MSTTEQPPSQPHLDRQRRCTWRRGRLGGGGVAAAKLTTKLRAYSPGEIDELTDATGVVPAVNQIEWTPALYDASTVSALRDRGVTLEGYSPFNFDFSLTGEVVATIDSLVG